MKALFRVWSVVAVLLFLAGCRGSVTRIYPTVTDADGGHPMRIVCLGDSLTTSGGPDGRYTDYLATWLPGKEVVNKGVAGDTLAGGRARFQTDVLDLVPDVVVIELGANDYWKACRPLADLEADLEYMVGACRRAGIEVVIASCFGDADLSVRSKEPGGGPQVDYATGIAEFERRIVRRYGAFHVPNMQADIKPNGRDPYWADRNHPNRRGNELVARRILGQLQLAIARASARGGRWPTAPREGR